MGKMKNIVVQSKDLSVDRSYQLFKDAGFELTHYWFDRMIGLPIFYDKYREFPSLYSHKECILFFNYNNAESFSIIVDKMKLLYLKESSALEIKTYFLSFIK